MKILWLTDFIPKTDVGEITGGVEARCFYVSKFLKKSGVQVKIIARQTTGSVWKPPTVASIPERIIFTAKSLIAGLNSDFDLIEGTNFATFPTAWVIGKLKRKPIVFWYPDVFLGSWVKNTGPIAGRIGELAEKIILKISADKFISISEETKKKLIANGVPAEKIEVIHCGANPEKEINSKIEYDVVAISRLLPYKRIEDLVLVANKLKLKVAILGRGPEEQKLKRMAGENINFISFLPKHRDVLKLISSAKIFCHPSTVEGFGIAVLEAMSQGKPVVVPDMPIFRETTAGKGALFFEPGNTGDLANKISKLLSDDLLRQKKSHEAKERASVFNWETISTETLNLYMDLLRPKICMVTDAWDSVWGGGQTHILELSKKLTEDYNYLVEIVVPSIKGSQRSQKLNKNLTIKRLPLEFAFPSILGRGVFLITLLFHLLRSNYKICHSHSFSTTIFFPLLKFFKNGKLVFTIHGKGDEILGGGVLNKLKIGSTLANLIIEKYKFDALITVAADSISGKTETEKIFTIGNGVNLEDFDAVEDKSRRGQKFLWVGRFVPVKNLDLLIKAFVNINKNFSNASLKLIGEGITKSAIETQIKTSKSSHFIKTKPFESGQQLIKSYKNADCFILPSRSGEGFPISVVEAMAAKLPVIATDIGDTKVLVGPKTGILIEPNNQQILESGIESIIKNASSKLLGENGHKLVKQKHTWNKIAQKTNEIYENC